MDREEIVLQVIAEVSGTEVGAIQPEAELVADLGVDSPRALQMLVEIEDRLEMEIDDKVIDGLLTVADVLEAIREYERSTD